MPSCRPAHENAKYPENVTSIGSRAFADSPNLKKVVLLTADAEIAEDAFEGCGEIEFEDQT